MKKLIRSYYNNDYVDSPQVFTEPSLTQQRYFAMNNLPTLIAQGVLSTDVGVYGDQLNASYEDLMNEKIKLQRDFSDLPIEVQRRFGSVANYLKFVSDFRNYQRGDEVEQSELVPIVPDDAERDPELEE